MLYSTKRFLIIAAIGIATALYFWTQSRYPDLSSKAMMAQSGTVADTIAARPIFEVRPEFPFGRKVLLSALNWCNDNKKGMTFGVFFAAILLTLAGYVPLPRHQNRALNTLYGFFIGAPLGVCVNCAAPIFKGILKTERVETAFAAMLSSPTMNVVVMTMVFSLFPLYMAVAKVLFALVAIFIGVPVIARLLGPKHPLADLSRITATERFLTPTAPSIPEQGGREGWWVALKGALGSLLKNFWFMVSRTVPLMIVAGFLGSLVSHAVPVGILAGESSVWAIALAAIIGIVLPVPMAFDVMLANALYSHGASSAIVMTLLCTLGIYSMYSFFITWQSASKTWAFALTGLLTLMGFGMGLLAPSLHDAFYVQRNLDAYHAFAKSGVEETAIDLVSVSPGPALPSLAPFLPVAMEARGPVKVGSIPFRPRAAATKPTFSKKEGHELGLGRGFRYGIRDYPDPFWIGRGTGAGDYNQDGWVDLVFGSERGLVLYANRGGWFEVQDLKIERLSEANVYAVALVDLTGDGWLDLFVTTFNQGNWLLVNKDGRFDAAAAIKVPNGEAVLTVSPAFQDLDRNGFLDILNGNMALGVVTGFHDFSARRASGITWNDGKGFRESSLAPDMGETMSTLISDLSGDGRPDIIMGHDFIFPDAIYLGDDKGGFSPNDAPSFLAQTPIYTMGLDSGDLDNDLRLDLLMTGTIERSRWVGEAPIDGVPPRQYAARKWDSATCATIKDPIAQNNCKILRDTDHLVPFYQQRNLSVENCMKLPGVAARQDCLLSTMWFLITNEDRRWDCVKDFGADKRLLAVCQILAERGRRSGLEVFAAKRPQVDGNYVYLATPEGTFVDINKRPGGDGKAFAHPGGWTWSARIADLDNDGWQDIFNAEGAVRSHDYGWNVFMKNIEGKKFEQRQFSTGLTNDFNMFSFSLLDLDFDGDLDIIGNSSVGPVQVYINESAGVNHSLGVALGGPGQGVGARIIIEYGGGRHQVREVKASGGYQSFDPAVVYFGLGAFEAIDAVTIRWPDQSEHRVEGPFPADRLYWFAKAS